MANRWVGLTVLTRTMFSVIAPLVMLASPIRADVYLAIDARPASFLDCNAIVPSSLTCQSLSTFVDTSIPSHVFVLVGGVDAAAVRFGVTYSPGISVRSWVSCAGGKETPGDTWPSSGSAIDIRFDACLEARNADSLTVVGVFTIEAGSSGTLTLSEEPDVGSAIVETCGGEPREVTGTNIGGAAFHDADAHHGNPCVDEPELTSGESSWLRQMIVDPHGYCRLPNRFMHSSHYVEGTVLGTRYESMSLEGTVRDRYLGNQPSTFSSGRSEVVDDVFQVSDVSISFAEPDDVSPIIQVYSYDGSTLSNGNRTLTASRTPLLEGDDVIVFAAQFPHAQEAYMQRGRHYRSMEFSEADRRQFRDAVLELAAASAMSVDELNELSQGTVVSCGDVAERSSPGFPQIRIVPTGSEGQKDLLTLSVPDVLRSPVARYTCGLRPVGVLEGDVVRFDMCGHDGAVAHLCQDGWSILRVSDGNYYRGFREVAIRPRGMTKE